MLNLVVVIYTYQIIILPQKAGFSRDIILVIDISARQEFEKWKQCKKR